MNHSALEDEGLPSPPLDEGAFLVAPTTTLELSQVVTSSCSCAFACLLIFIYDFDLL